MELREMKWALKYQNLHSQGGNLLLEKFQNNQEDVLAYFEINPFDQLTICLLTYGLKEHRIFKILTLKDDQEMYNVLHHLYFEINGHQPFPTQGSIEYGHCPPLPNYYPDGTGFITEDMWEIINENEFCLGFAMNGEELVEQLEILPDNHPLI